MRYTHVSLGLGALVALVACEHDHRLTETVGQIERVRAGVTLAEPGHGAAPLEDTLRLVAGAEVVTNDTGRALLQLDHGERLLLDRNTRVKLVDSRHAALEAGRVWIQAAPLQDPLAGEDAALQAGTLSLHLRGVRASIQRDGDGATLDVLGGEVAYESSSRRGAVHAGEHAVLHASEARTTPRPLFDDWTGAMADELPEAVSVSGAVGLGAVAARRPSEAGAPRWPLVVQRLDARVSVVGDLAVTELEQTFFNPSSDTVEGLYTLSVPRGAVLQRFAVDRHGTLVDGFVRERQAAARAYQEQVYQGSTHDPALLEWDAPGRYHARLYPITPAMTRRVLVTYTQWLTPRSDGGRTYRLPLASLGTRIGELRADIDLTRAGATEVRASAGSRRDETHVTLTRSDVIPTADFVLDLRGAPPREGTSVRVDSTTRAQPQTTADPTGYLRVTVRAPDPEAREARDEGVDLVLVVDHSAAMDPTALQLGQALAEALTRSLTERDRLLVLAGDVGTRPVGREAPRLESVTEDTRRTVLDALAHDRRGGATDLGAMIEAAHGALDPQRNGAIVYIGDGQATVGEGDLPALRARLARMSPHPRLYAVAVGESPRLDLLAGLTEPSGFATRVVRRGDVARTALDLLAHAARPLVRDFRADLGPGVERVYPSGAVDLPAGEPLVVVGRYTNKAPTSVTVRASWHGRETSRTVALSGMALPDHDDLRYRWATARLDQLLAQGESRAVIVELGTRFGLITPFTSLYVPSEDEPLPPGRGPRTSDARESLSVFDLLPLVGCSRQREAPAAVEVAPSSNSAPAQPGLPNPTVAPQGVVRDESEGRMGHREAPRRSARYAVRNNDPSSGASPNVDTTTATTAPAAPEPAPAPQNQPVMAPMAPPVTTEIPPEAAQQMAQAATDQYARGAQPTARPSARRIAREQTADQGVFAALRATGESNPLAGGDLEGGGGGASGDAFARPALGAARRHGGRAHATQNGYDNHNEDGVIDLDGDDRVAANRVAGQTGSENSRDRDRGRFEQNREGEGQIAARALARCSDAASVSIAERVPLWRERLEQNAGAHGAVTVWNEARRQCELPAWPDKVALLRLMVAHAGSVDGQITLYRLLQRDAGARGWLRDSLLRTLARTGELARASSLGLQRLDGETLTAALAHATTAQERLNVLRLLARRFPDDLDLTLLLLDAAAAVGDASEVRRTAARIREDARADARTRTAVGEALLAIHDDLEARRTFSEIVEFAPEDPWARRRLGDIALAHGWADEAYRQYQTLAAQLHEAPEILLRLAWAARKAGRLDEAIRLAERVTTQSAPGATGTVSEAAAAWIATELALAGTESDVPRETLTALRARWRRSPAARNAGAVRVILRWTHPDDEAELWATLPSDAPRRADLVASLVPLETVVYADAPESLALEVRRGGGARPRGDAELIVIWNEGSERERVARQTLTFDPEHTRFLFDARDGQVSARAISPNSAAGGP